MQGTVNHSKTFVTKKNVEKKFILTHSRGSRCAQNQDMRVFQGIHTSHPSIFARVQQLDFGFNLRENKGKIYYVSEMKDLCSKALAFFENS